MSTGKVIITRPLAQAVPLAERVRALGRESVIFPLLEIQPLPDRAFLRSALQELSTYAMAAFVSPNAIDAVFGELSSWPPGVPIAVMGEGSRQALANYGVTSDNANIISPHDSLRTDSQTLLDALDLEALRGKQVVIFRGEAGRELLADALRANGVEVKQVAAYRRAAPEWKEALRIQLSEITAGENDWLVTSSEALRILIEMLERLNEGDPVAKMQRQHIIVPHVRIAETARALGLEHITLVGSGDEHLIAALQSRA